MKLRPFIVLSLLLVWPAGLLPAAEPATDGDRVRAALRDTTLQLRNAQAELAGLQAAQAAFAEEKKAMTEKYEALKRQTVADRSVTDKTVAGLGAQMAEQKNALARLNEALEKAKAEGEKAAQAARTLEAQGAKLTNDNIILERRAADREAKNLALFLIGNEILTRYEEFSLGNALRAKEPFVGLTRTRLENLVQDYQDKLLEQRARP